MIIAQAKILTNENSESNLIYAGYEFYIMILKVVEIFVNVIYLYTVCIQNVAF